jgi:hypothetical protein
MMQFSVGNRLFIQLYSAGSAAGGTGDTGSFTIPAGNILKVHAVTLAIFATSSADGEKLNSMELCITTPRLDVPPLRLTTDGGLSTSYSEPIVFGENTSPLTLTIYNRTNHACTMQATLMCELVKASNQL